MHGIHLKGKGLDLDKGGEAPDMGRQQVLVLLQVSHQIDCYIDHRFRFVPVPRLLGRLLLSG